MENEKKGKGRPMGKRYTHTWSIRLTERQMALIEKIAEQEERDKIDVVRDAIEAWAKQKGVK